MLEFLFSIVLILIAAIWFFLWVKPKKELENYARLFEQQGFKVYKYPFKFMGTEENDRFTKNTYNQMDAFAIVKD